MSEEWTENGVQYLIVYSYDASGYPISMTYRKSADAAATAEVYFLATNLQGDVTYIYDIDGNRVVTYNYDAWGNILSISGTKASTIGRYNPFRYRSYYYDNETGFYYLNSRYYDPASGRFLNADGQLNDGLLDELTPDTSGENTEATERASEIYEMTERREESVKHFHCSDGTNVAVQYDMPVRRSRM